MVLVLMALVKEFDDCDVVGEGLVREIPLITGAADVGLAIGSSTAFASVGLLFSTFATVSPPPGSLFLYLSKNGKRALNGDDTEGVVDMAGFAASETKT